MAIFELRIGLLWSRNPADSALWLHRLAVRHARKTLTGRPQVTSDMPAPGIDVLAAVPGISTRTARVLLERLGSIAGLVEAGPDRWAAVDGIGAVRAHVLSPLLY